uniref:EF-hand domain-containing protein n=1 Tax=Palpitomonas bilix TaxID=652834 RepID=A0A7S3CXE5_9EUKA|mmetsp:Transcript_13314/g.34906  ORF Transcript_13314/g.34906 Transcript_13314/m.34906 type:complete len:165 (+) Transcript_13314:161-655(+)|eukprot:CAMPEP_0113879864 /NCGR_PEP_ID=MMETSP0780_2-20120614/7467_1 /TAXON_ID=652834 /ORGANISM="Palpitomonas bilix" /LENGTH=164 /DNA_ID=CAMNT_0000866477 /DNA_START=125 /DNA_END=619 /DNA_ORIENTATION=+ /assembly_acc=CAM_ASM_000599
MQRRLNRLGRSKSRFELSEEQRAELIDAFKLFDTEGSGCIGYYELKTCARALGFEAKKSDVRRWMADTDLKDAEKVDLEEFLEIMRVRYSERDPDEELEKAFELFDEDNSGKISLKNLRKICKSLGEKIPDDEMAAMIDEFDRDNDGEINKEEFFNIVKAPQDL